MSAANKKLSDSIDMILKELKEIKSDIKTLKNDTSVDRELMNLIHVKVSDLSSKVDLDISTLNITTKTTTKKTNTVTESEKKTKPNVMVFFKNKFKTDPESVSFLYTQIELDKLFKEHADIIRTKSSKKETGDNYKAGLVYKHLIKDHSDSKNRVKKLKDLKESEENADVVVSPEVLENNFSDEEPQVAKKYKESSDSDSD
jgi:hypothetical protein